MFLIATMPDIVDEAVWLTEAERDEGVRRARAGLEGAGAADCAACGDEIDPARRAALPSATRCVACQSRVERGSGYPERIELGDNL